MTAKINIDMLANLKLGSGSGGIDRCLMESVALLTGEKRTDKPSCVAPSLITMGIHLNDWATDEQRQTLKAFVPRVIGTAGDHAAEERRKYLCIDAAVREFAPLWLERARFTNRAERLRAMPEIVDQASAKGAHELAQMAASVASAASTAYASYSAASAAASSAASYASYAAASCATSYASYANASYSAAAAAASTAYAASATASSAAASATYAASTAHASAEMGMWERLRDLFDRMIRVSETPLGMGEARSAELVLAESAVR
jgi:hypothetical protein